MNTYRSLIIKTLLCTLTLYVWLLFFNYYSEQKNSETIYQERYKKVFANSLGFFAHSLWGFNRKSAENLIKSLFEDHSIENILLFDTHGDLFFGAENIQENNEYILKELKNKVFTLGSPSVSLVKYNKIVYEMISSVQIVSAQKSRLVAPLWYKDFNKEDPKFLGHIIMDFKLENDKFNFIYMKYWHILVEIFSLLIALGAIYFIFRNFLKTNISPFRKRIEGILSENSLFIKNQNNELLFFENAIDHLNSIVKVNNIEKEKLLNFLSEIEKTTSERDYLTCFKKYLLSLTGVRNFEIWVKENSHFKNIESGLIIEEKTLHLTTEDVVILNQKQPFDKGFLIISSITNPKIIVHFTEDENKLIENNSIINIIKIMCRITQIKI